MTGFSERWDSKIPVASRNSAVSSIAAPISGGSTIEKMAANGQTEAADSGRARSQDGVQGSQSDRACRNWRCRTDGGLRSPLVPSLSSIVSGVMAEVGIQLPSPEVKE